AGSRVPGELDGLLKQILAVDGTFLPAAADVAWAVTSRNQREGERHRARLDVHIDVQTWLPEVIAVPDPGESEGDCAARTLKPNAIHVYDRGFCNFDLIAAHRSADRDDVSWRADFVLRLREPGPNAPTIETIEDRPLEQASIAAGVVSDHIVRLPGLEKKHQTMPQLRLVVIRLPDQTEIRLLTTLDIQPELIALLYRFRWQIELFFRWLKCYAHFDHMISHSARGVLLNFYVVIVGVLLMYLHTGYRPSKYLLVLLGTVAQGGTLEDILPILRERERQCERDRQSAARRRAKKQG
ncbi:MAG: IS4 family transposase, partial [Nitrososphaera sp.]|uniref:IS4 family transposase n=1 Tax=Nitrososphaera sp. TaxID=1971748 RepID=UPI003D6F9539